MRASDLPASLELHPSKVSSADQVVMRGGSAIIAPDGTYLAGPCFEEEVVLVATLDLARVREESMTLDVSGHHHRPELLALQVRCDTRAISRPSPETS